MSARKTVAGDSARRPRFVGYDPVARQFPSGSDVVVMRASAGERQDVPSRLEPWKSFLSQSNVSPSLDTLNPYRICDDKVQSGYFASRLRIPSLRTERLCPAEHLDSYSSWTRTLNLQEHHSGGVVLKPISETFSRGLIVVDWNTSAANQSVGAEQSDGAESSLVTTWSVSGGSQDCCDHREGSDVFVIPPGTVRTYVVPHGAGSADEGDLMMLLQQLIQVDGLAESYLFQERAQVNVEVSPAPFEIKVIVIAGKAFLMKGPWFRESTAEVPKAWRRDPSSNSPEAWDWNTVDSEACSDPLDDRCTIMQKILTVMQSVTPRVVEYAERMAEARFKGLTFRADFFIELADAQATGTSRGHAREPWSVVDVTAETEQHLTVTLNEIEPGWGMLRACLNQLSDWYSTERVTANNISFVASVDEMALDAKFGVVSVMRAAAIETCHVDRRVEPWQRHFETLSWDLSCPAEQLFESLSCELQTCSDSIESLAGLLSPGESSNIDYSTLQTVTLAKSLDIPTHDIQGFTSNDAASWSKDLTLKQGKGGELVVLSDCGEFEVSWTVDHQNLTFNSLNMKDASFTRPQIITHGGLNTEDFQEELVKFVLDQTSSHEYYVQQKSQGNVESDDAPFKIRVEVLGQKAALVVLKPPWAIDSCQHELMPKAWRRDPTTECLGSEWCWSQTDSPGDNELQNNSISKARKIQEVMGHILPTAVAHAEHVARELNARFVFHADFIVELKSNSCCIPPRFEMPEPWSVFDDFDPNRLVLRLDTVGHGLNEWWNSQGPAVQKYFRQQDSRHVYFGAQRSTNEDFMTLAIQALAKSHSEQNNCASAKAPD